MMHGSTVSKITIAKNIDPANAWKPTARTGSDGIPIGAFYVPVGHHLRISIADISNGGGWYQGRGSAVANIGTGTSMWVTRADGYNYPNRDPLLLLEPNVNDYDQSFEKGTIWFDVSAVDGINTNV